jgi:hypothetical protein
MWSWKLDSETAGISALIAADAASFMSAFNPSLFTIRAFRSSADPVAAQQTASDLYRGMALGAVLTLVVGFGGSAITRSWWPLVMAVATLAVLIGAYRWAINTPRGSGGIEAQYGSA